MGHTTVRIREETRETLRALAEAEGKPMQAVLEEAIEALRRLRFLQRVNDGYAALRESPTAWAGVEKERREWDGSLQDGLGVAEKGGVYAAKPRPATSRPSAPARRRRPGSKP